MYNGSDKLHLGVILPCKKCFEANRSLCLKGKRKNEKLMARTESGNVFDVCVYVKQVREF